MSRSCVDRSSYYDSRHHVTVLVIWTVVTASKIAFPLFYVLFVDAVYFRGKGKAIPLQAWTGPRVQGD
jgi:hypothetical protein